MIRRYCPGCDENISLWAIVRRPGSLTEVCADCGCEELVEVVESVRSAEVISLDGYRQKTTQ